MRVFYLLILSHLLADFVFQGETLAQRKRNSFLVLAVHSLVFLLCSFILLLFFRIQMSAALIAILLILTFIHFVFDAFKNQIDIVFSQKKFEWLILDQIIHAGAILSAWIYLYPSINLSNFANLLKTKAFPDRIILIIIGYIFMWGGTYFIKRFMEKIPPIKSDLSEFNVGFIIGNIERFLIFTLVLADQYAVIGLVLAAKSIARFDELKKREFAEYYLVGTLLSVLIAVGAGVVIKFLIR